MVIPDRSVEDSLVWWLESPWILWEANELSYINRNNASLGWEEQRWGEIKEEWLWGQSHEWWGWQDHHGQHSPKGQTIFFSASEGRLPPRTKTNTEGHVVLNVIDSPVGGRFGRKIPLGLWAWWISGTEALHALLNLVFTEALGISFLYLILPAGRLSSFLEVSCLATERTLMQTQVWF